MLWIFAALLLLLPMVPARGGEITSRTLAKSIQNAPAHRSVDTRSASGSHVLRVRFRASGPSRMALADQVRELDLPSGATLGPAHATFGTAPRPAAHTTAAGRSGIDRWVTVEVYGDVGLVRQRWAADPRVEVVEEAVEWETLAAPTDPLYPQQWEHDNTGANPVAPPGTPDADLDTAEAWDLATGAGVLVTNFESLVWYHEDLVDRVRQNLGEDANGNGRVLEWDAGLGRYVLDPGDPNALDDDGNGFIDDLVGWNFKHGTNRPEDGPLAHGTGTAGFLLATHENSVGVAGTCPDCELLPIRGNLMQGLTYAVDEGVHVISLSLTGIYSEAWHDFVDYANQLGVVIVASAGNEGTEVASSLCGDGVLCVGGTNHRDRIVTLTNTGGGWGSAYGPALDLAAPAIYQTYLRSDGSYGTGGSGTSNAAPLVAGVAALVREVAPSLTSAEVRAILETTVDPFDQPDRFAGNGRVNARAAVEAAILAESLGSFPMASLSSATGIDPNGRLRVVGSASSPQWSSGRVRIGVGLEPTQWLLDSPLAGSVVDAELAVTDVTAQTVGTEYWIELEVHDAFGQVAIDRMHPIRQATDVFEPIPWPLLASTTTSLGTGDLDGDGAAELVALSDEWTAYRAGGTVLSGWPLSGTDWVGDAAFVDLDALPGEELVVLDRAVSLVSAYRSDGTAAPGWPVALAGPAAWSPVVGDVSGDGAEEVVVVCDVGGSNSLYVIRADGTLVPGWPRSLPSFPVSSPTLGDLDGDGDLEVVGRTIAETYAYQEDGQVVTGFPLAGGTVGRPICADLDRDGKDEVVRFDLTETSVFRGDGTPLTGWPASVVAAAGQWVADCDGDGSLDVLLAENNATWWLLDAAGAVYPGWPVQVVGGLICGLSDVDGDGAQDILYLDHELADALGALAASGQTVAGWPLPLGGTLRSITAGALDSDGLLELFVQTSAPDNTPWLHRFEFPIPATDGGWWNEGRDRTNARRARVPVPVAVPSGGASGPFAFAPPFPQPAARRSTLRWSLHEASSVAVVIYDVHGRRVRNLLRAFRSSGDHEAVWDLRSDRRRRVASGVYFVHLETDSGSQTRRVVVRP